jgi:hypothetical protein
MLPPWFKLLIHNQRTQRRFGLTLVFLLGATRTPIGRRIRDEQKNRKQFTSLLESMRDQTPDGYYIHIGECDRLREPVANPNISYGEVNPVYRTLPSKRSRLTRLVLQPKYFPHPTEGMDSIVEVLWPHLKIPVMAGLFSFRSGRFDQFDPSDLDFIAEALSTPDEEESI